MIVAHPSNFFDFTEKNVLVTGAASGIGAGIAQRFAEAGANLAIHCNAHKDEAEALAETVRKSGRRSLVLQADLTRAENIEKMFSVIERHIGGLDILVNNAGIYPTHRLLEMTPENWDETLNINLKSVFLCTQAAAKQMIRLRKDGSIINISSIEAVNPAPGHCHYSASKAGVVMFSMNAALELGPHHIRVNAVAPGLINSPRLASSWPDGVARWQNRAPLGRLGEPVDVADACLFFASDASRWITGSHLIVDGGVMTSQIF